jgi:hypothetical protein
MIRRLIKRRRKKKVEEEEDTRPSLKSYCCTHELKVHVHCYPNDLKPVIPSDFHCDYARKHSMCEDCVPYRSLSTMIKRTLDKQKV